MKEGIELAQCEKCNVNVSKEDLYEDHGLQICEDCKMKNAVSPPESCANMKNMIK
ncbi:hypothetical protein UF75_1314 [Desulfosporosinus sp. I2]|nr:hypothetical protein UF75_1314 [Desulfosporosinus sp. I2]